MRERKNEHLILADKAQAKCLNDQRFYYEPLLGHHNVNDNSCLKTEFLHYNLGAPLWISSMTGGTTNNKAREINERLARACHHFSLGMGVGSCRPLLEDNKNLDDFNLRPILGDDLPFFSNLGIAQVDYYLRTKQIEKILDLISHLKFSGLIIHINPLQEWLQPEGDSFLRPPLEILEELLEVFPYDVIVKEVGQGMGPESIKALLKLPIKTFDFAAYGGTNFSKLELFRNEQISIDINEGLTRIGHTNDEMISYVKQARQELGAQVKCQSYIISGGINSFLDGYYYMKKLNLPCLYAQGKTILKYADASYDELLKFLGHQIRGLVLAKNYLRLRGEV